MVRFIQIREGKMATKQFAAIYFVIRKQESVGCWSVGAVRDVVPAAKKAAGCTAATATAPAEPQLATPPLISIGGFQELGEDKVAGWFQVSCWAEPPPPPRPTLRARGGGWGGCPRPEERPRKSLNLVGPQPFLLPIDLPMVYMCRLMGIMIFIKLAFPWVDDCTNTNCWCKFSITDVQQLEIKNYNTLSMQK